MTGGNSPAPVPLFIDADGRKLFALHHSPAGAAKGSVLMLPPFAEELNMSRRMTYLLGRALAQAGFGFLLPDLTGTGESAGDFVDARWDIWQSDAETARRWLTEAHGHPPVVLGLRAGALLAASLDPVARLILWQPVGNGQTLLNQFLRIRVAAGLMGNGEKESTQSLRAEWTAGRPVEIAGYEIHPDLAAALDPLRLAQIAPPAGTRVDWIETGNAETGPSPASARTLDAWRDGGCDVRVDIRAGDPFWTIQETTLAPALIDATLAALQTP